jgi:hypothetical protein
VSPSHHFVHSEVRALRILLPSYRALRVLALGQGKYDIACADALVSADDTDGYVIVAGYLLLVLGDQPLHFLLVSCHVDALQARGDGGNFSDLCSYNRDGQASAIKWTTRVSNPLPLARQASALPLS